MVINQRRMGGQTQHSALLDMTPKSDRIQLVVAYIRQNLRSPLSVEELAAVANLSPRQFSRAFLAETGQSPAKAVERLRLEAARFMIEEGRHSVKVVAQETGFAGPRTHAPRVPAGLRRTRGGLAEECSTGGGGGCLTRSSHGLLSVRPTAENRVLRIPTLNLSARSSRMFLQPWGSRPPF